MRFVDRLEGMARGEEATADLRVLSAAGADAYELADAGVAGWCAFVLQTLGDRLIESGSTPETVQPAVAEYVRRLFADVEKWLRRARSGRLDVSVPQALPPAHLEPDHGVLVAVRETLEAAQARLDRDAAIADALDRSARLWADDAGPGVRREIAAALCTGLERAYELGQLAAGPQRALRPADPWCLTDPLLRPKLAADEHARDAIEQLWQRDLGQTAAIQSEIDEALAAGEIDFLPHDDIPVLSAIAGECPWPGIYWARTALTLAGCELVPGARFVLSVRERRLVVA